MKIFFFDMNLFFYLVQLGLMIYTNSQAHEMC